MMGCFLHARAGAVRALGVVFVLAVGSVARAENIEVRDFATSIDGAASGSYRMTITKKDDGAVTMVGDANIKVVKLGITAYHYTYHGTENWSNGRLLGFESKTDDDGTKYTVSATPEKNGLRLKVNGNERMVRPDVWITSYWQLPETRRRDKSLPLLDADEGKTVTGALRSIGTEQILVAGQRCNCAHYRITGPVIVDAWYDGQDRLVRQEWEEKGHKVQMVLTSVKR
jgi:hypothetical protein